MTIARRAMFVLAIAIAAIVGGVARADTASYAVTASCTGGGQLCNNLATVNVYTGGLLTVQILSNSALACSSFRVHVLLDGIEKTVTGFIAPGGSSAVLDLGTVSSGSHVLGLQGEGQTGGCNSGTLGGWTATLVVTTSQSSIPTLSAWGLATLSFLVLLVGAWRLR